MSEYLEEVLHILRRASAKYKQETINQKILLAISIVEDALKEIQRKECGHYGKTG